MDTDQATGLPKNRPRCAGSRRWSPRDYGAVAAASASAQSNATLS